MQGKSGAVFRAFLAAVNSVFRRITPVRCVATHLAVAVCVIMSACSVPEPVWRGRTSLLVDELGRQEAPGLFPQEYRNVLETFEHGEAFFRVREDHASADIYYRLAFQKAELLILP